MTITTSPHEFNLAYLDTLRDSLGITVPDLAERVGYDMNDLWRVLGGHTPATPDLAIRCLRVLAAELQTQGKTER